MRIKEARKRQICFLLYLLGFHAAWTACVILGYPRLRLLGEQTLRYMLINVLVRTVIWVLPVFIYLRYVNGVIPSRFLKLREYWRTGVLTAVVFSIFNFLFFMVQRGWPHFRAGDITWNSLVSTTFLIGFIEEVPYRGLIFQQLNEWFTFPQATLISSILFVVIHLPGWLSLHIFNARVAIFVLVFGLLMVGLLRYSKSLWAPIVSHSLNDFFSTVLFRI